MSGYYLEIRNFIFAQRLYFLFLCKVFLFTNLFGCAAPYKDPKVELRGDKYYSRYYNSNVTDGADFYDEEDELDVDTNDDDTLSSGDSDNNVNTDYRKGNNNIDVRNNNHKVVGKSDRSNEFSDFNDKSDMKNILNKETDSLEDDDFDSEINELLDNIE